MSRVSCYAGARYPERPMSFELDGVRVAVAKVERQVRTPDGIVFSVVSQDGRRFRLAWLEAKDTWNIDLLSG